MKVNPSLACARSRIVLVTIVGALLFFSCRRDCSPSTSAGWVSDIGDLDLAALIVGVTDGLTGRRRNYRAPAVSQSIECRGRLALDTGGVRG